MGYSFKEPFILVNTEYQMDSKASRLFEIAKTSNFVGQRDVAKEMMILAFSQEDAIEALDKLLPKVPEPMSNEEYKDLTTAQVNKILEIAQELKIREKQHLAAKILAKVEASEKLKKRKRKTQP